MSKRSIIIAVVSVLLFVGALFSVMFDFKNKPEASDEPDDEPETILPGDIYEGIKKGFKWNKVTKKYEPLPVTIIENPVPDDIIKDEKIINNA